MFNHDFNQINILRKAIIEVIAFFDLFEYPLTSYEIWDYLGREYSLVDILKVLVNNSVIIGSQNGFYFLLGREVIINTRQQRYNYTNYKIKKAKRFAFFLNFLPFIQVITIANSIGAHNLRKGSDIDFFIITSPGCLWLSRFYCAGLAKLLNLRPTAHNKKDKICLSFYISTEHLNLDDLKLQPSDPYFNYWISNLILLYNKKENYQQFLIANRLLIGVSKTIGQLPNFFIRVLEKLAKELQLRIMSADLRQEMNNSSGVVINDQVLKLYVGDRRQEFFDKFNSKLHEIFSKIN